MKIFRFLPLCLLFFTAVAEAQSWRTEVHYDVVGAPGVEIIEGDLDGIGQYYARWLFNGADFLGTLANEQRTYNVSAQCQSGLATRSDYRLIGTNELFAELFQCDQYPFEEYVRVSGINQPFYLQRR